MNRIEEMYDWCIKYCENNNLDCTYYRDWHIAEKEYEKYKTQLTKEIQSIYTNAIKNIST